MAEGCVCQGCGEPVRDGDARYTAMEPREYWHWECWDRRFGKEAMRETGEHIDASLARVKELIRRLRR